MSTIGKRIKRLREERGLTQDELGRQLRTTGMTVSRWERRTSVPSDENLAALAELFGVAEPWLVYGDLEQAPRPTKPQPTPTLPHSHVDTSEADAPGDADVVMDILRQLERERGKPIPGRMVQKVLAANHLGGATYDSVKNLLLDLFLEDSGKVQDRAEPVKVDTGRGGMALGPPTKKKKR